jgi:amino-acid N-acetyltransferase
MLAPLGGAQYPVPSTQYPLPPTQVEGSGVPQPPSQAFRSPVLVRAAQLIDMAQVEPLIAGFAAQGLMLPKTLEQLCRLFREFVVATDAEDRVIGCGALRVYTPQLAEVASLAVAESAHGLGVGRLLVEQLAVEARSLGIGTIFALTLSDAFFHRLGFRTVPKELFPLKVWSDCRGCAKLHACDEIAVVREL